MMVLVAQYQDSEAKWNSSIINIHTCKSQNAFLEKCLPYVSGGVYAFRAMI